MICTKCNFQNEETAKFCRNCGNRMENTPAEIQSQKQNHDILGITGFLISLFLFLSNIRPLIWFIQTKGVGHVSGSGGTGVLIAYLIAFSGFTLSFIAFFVQNNRKKTFAIVGTVISAINIIFILML